MKIVVIGTTAGCVIGFRAELIRALVSRGHEVFVFALDYTDESRKAVLGFGGVPVDYTFSRTGLNPLSDLNGTWKLANQFKMIGPDLVFSYFAKPVIFGTLAAKLAGVNRRIGMLEGLGFIFTDQPEGISRKTRLLRKIQVLLYRVSFPLLEKVIFLNPDDPYDLVTKHQIKVNQVEVLGGIGLDLEKYTYVRPDIKRISFLFIGRLLKEKGINEFIAAAKIVKQQYPEVNFTVLGGMDKSNPGGLREDERKRLIATGVIDCPGHVADVRKFITESSVFVLPSYREGVPRSTQEAMAIGRPVITTDVPGCRETVINGVNGFLIPPWQPKALADRMIYFIQNPGKIEPMGLESYRLARQKYDAEMVNRKLINILNV